MKCSNNVVLNTFEVLQFQFSSLSEDLNRRARTENQYKSKYTIIDLCIRLKL